MGNILTQRLSAAAITALALPILSTAHGVSPSHNLTLPHENITLTSSYDSFGDGKIVEGFSTNFIDSIKSLGLFFGGALIEDMHDKSAEDSYQYASAYYAHWAKDIFNTYNSDVLNTYFDSHDAGLVRFYSTASAIDAVISHDYSIAANNATSTWFDNIENVFIYFFDSLGAHLQPKALGEMPSTIDSLTVHYPYGDLASKLDPAQQNFQTSINIHDVTNDGPYFAGQWNNGYPTLSCDDTLAVSCGSFPISGIPDDAYQSSPDTPYRTAGSVISSTAHDVNKVSMI